MLSMKMYKCKIGVRDNKNHAKITWKIIYDFPRTAKTWPLNQYPVPFRDQNGQNRNTMAKNG